MGVATALYNTALIMPSYPPHLPQICRFLDSMLRFCPSCAAAPIYVVVSDDTRELFQNELGRFRGKLLLDVVSVQAVAPFYFAGQPDAALDGALPGRFVLQSLKKIYGCMHARAHNCWVLDSESFFVRNTSFHDLVHNWLMDPLIIGNAHKDRSGESPSRIAVDILGLDSAQGSPPWFLENYLWIWERPILEELVATLERARPSLAAFSNPVFFGTALRSGTCPPSNAPQGALNIQWFFVAQLYPSFIWSQKRDAGRFPNYRFLDTEDDIIPEPGFWAPDVFGGLEDSAPSRAPHAFAALTDADSSPTQFAPSGTCIREGGHPLPGGTRRTIYML